MIVSNYTENAHASISLHVMDGAPVKARLARNVNVPTLGIDAGSSNIDLFFWGPDAPAKLTTIRDAIDAWLAVNAK
jgi:hypothetical protein